MTDDKQVYDVYLTTADSTNVNAYTNSDLKIGSFTIYASSNAASEAVEEAVSGMTADDAADTATISDTGNSLSGGLVNSNGDSATVVAEVLDTQDILDSIAATDNEAGNTELMTNVQSAIASGETIIIKTELTETNAITDSVAKSDIDGEISSDGVTNANTYFNVELEVYSKKVSDGTETLLGNITKLPEEIDITVSISDALYAKLSGKSVFVYRYHEGDADTVEAIPATLGGAAGSYTLSFKTDKLSTFAIAYTNTVTFNSNGGSAVESVSVADDATFVFPTTTRSGYTFKGWSSDGGTTLYAAGATSPAVTGNVTYTAYWSSTGGSSYVPSGGGGGASTVSVTGITLDKTTASVEVGKTVTLTATVAPSNASNKTVTWTSSDEKIATVKDGVVIGVAEGTVTITATTSDGKKTATATITVTKASTDEGKDDGSDDGSGKDDGSTDCSGSDSGTDAGEESGTDDGSSDGSTTTVKKANTLTVKNKTIAVKVKSNNKKTKTKKTITIKAAKVTKGVSGKGTITYTKKSGNKKIVIAKNGKITVKKGIKTSKKGRLYTVKITVKAAGNSQYKAATKTMTVKIKVKAK